MADSPWYVNFDIKGTNVERSPCWVIAGPNKPAVPFVIEVTTRDQGEAVCQLLDNALRRTDEDLIQQGDGGAMYRKLKDRSVIDQLDTTFESIESFYTILFGRRIAIFITERSALNSLSSNLADYRRGYRYGSVGPALEALLTRGKVAERPLDWNTGIEDHVSQLDSYGWINPVTPTNSPSQRRVSSTSLPARSPTSPSPSGKHPSRATKSPVTPTTPSRSPGARAKSAHALHSPKGKSPSASTSRAVSGKQHGEKVRGDNPDGPHTSWQQLFDDYASIHLSHAARAALNKSKTYSTFSQRLEGSGTPMTPEAMEFAWRFYEAAGQEDIILLSEQEQDDD
ncbi:hypothetical protein CYLTODRAFT_494773 [Cylindrobasidium torrendii FP15055 ss-10]|uniref:Uncharacterized protein n=1 Tax=Cylindrobasidium torrendii FP15055 ss-10 TaxID=1314674 RepID=A0A0D7AYA1_9AGAR|nr:hypothetical protein CYLTODRAFT_494773 [Cylindrobasidium torrendii FP15055 ss-10]